MAQIVISCDCACY